MSRCQNVHFSAGLCVREFGHAGMHCSAEDSRNPGGSKWAWVDPAPAAEPETKDTNPKDALGSMRAPLHLLPLPAIVFWSLAHAEGGSKYGLWNWCIAGVRASIYVAAAIRHTLKWFYGQETDPNTGVHHLGYVMACCAILIDAQWRKKLVDDRPPALPRIDELFAMAERLMPGLAALRTGVVRDYTIADSEKDAA
jgi:hypothetical protein